MYNRYSRRTEKPPASCNLARGAARRNLLKRRAAVSDSIARAAKKRKGYSTMTNLFTASKITTARAALYNFTGSFADSLTTFDGETIMQACAAAYLAIINKRERLGRIDPASAQRERRNLPEAVSTVYIIAASASEKGKDVDNVTGCKLPAWITLYRAANAAIMRVYREDYKHACALQLDKVVTNSGEAELIESINLHARRGISKLDQPEECLLKIDVQNIARAGADARANTEARERFAAALLLTANKAEAKKVSKINPRACATLCNQIADYLNK